MSESAPLAPSRDR